MLPCHNLWDLEEQRGRVFLNLSYGGKGKSHKQEELLWGAIKKLPKELTTELLYLELPTISASCGVKRYMHYIRFLLTKTHKQRRLNQFFLLDLFLFTWYWFFINLQMTTEWAFAFLNIAVIIFCLMYSLNILHQTPSFFPACDAVSIFSKFRFRRHFTSYTVTGKEIFFVWFSHCHGRRNYILPWSYNITPWYYIVCLSFPGPQAKSNWVFQVY